MSDEITAPIDWLKQAYIAMDNSLDKLHMNLKKDDVEMIENYLRFSEDKIGKKVWEASRFLRTTDARVWMKNEDDFIEDD